MWYCANKLVGNKIIYVIGDKNGIITFINLINNKLITPRIYSFNKLIEFMNQQYLLNLPLTKRDESDLLTNSWL